MKDIVIICLIIIIIVFSAIFVQRFLTQTTDELVEKVANLKERVKNGEDNEAIKKETNKVYAEWQDLNEKWAIITLHEELDLIERSFTRMKSAIECGEIEDGLEEIDVSIFLLNHIKEKEKFCLKNIL